MTRDDKKSARKFALRALGRRMHTAWEIFEALSRRGFGGGIVREVVEDLVRQGYINDHHFAQVWVTSRSVHQMHGRLRLLRDLRQKGVPDEIAEPVLREALTEETEVSIAIKAAEKKRRTLKATGAKGRDALYRHLRSKGFTTQVIKLAMADFIFEEDPF
jgi:regulatory protein